MANDQMLRPGGQQGAGEPAAAAGSAPGKRTLTESLPVQRKANGSAGGESQGVADGGASSEGAKGGDKPKAETTENLGGTLWAKDDAGKDLPPSIEDISQGGLNDCYVFASMAAIVHSNPALIKSMIKDNGDGTYKVTFHGTGWFSADEQTVSADLVKGKHGNMQSRKALWPLIIEKAYAKEKGGIDKLDTGGNAGDAVKDFVDKGASRFDPRAKDAAWILAKLAKAQADKKPTTILAPKKDDASKEKKAMSDKIPGLHFWHIYTITGVDEKGQRVKLFNPWGHDHPNGDGWLDINDLKTFFIEVDING